MDNFDVSIVEAKNMATSDIFVPYLFESLPEDIACDIATSLNAFGANVSWSTHGYYDDLFEFRTPKKLKYCSRTRCHYNECNCEAITEFDCMSGIEFEKLCAEILLKNGFKNIELTPHTGDQGVDILAEKGFIKYAIQCKHYNSPVGNTCVQEVHAGKIYYNCHVGVVMTNSVFTQSAKSLAEATGVLLWDREILSKYF
ncbi:MAG: restriction endonuclease [Clostridia bacterium]|nr:restriction endonuclease [Clostridia bacterium]